MHDEWDVGSIRKVRWRLGRAHLTYEGPTQSLY
jgi:hypothetical protein